MTNVIYEAKPDGIYMSIQKSGGLLWLFEIHSGSFIIVDEARDMVVRINEKENAIAYFEKERYDDRQSQE